MRWAIGILMLLAAAYRTPLNIALGLDISKKSSIWATIGAGKMHMDFDGELSVGDDRSWMFSLRRRGSKKARTLPLSKWFESIGEFIAIATQIEGAQDFIKKHMKFTAFSADCRIGLGDAAYTAVACGIIMTAVHMICAPRSVVPVLKISPDYANEVVIIASTCMFTVQSGHIMIAALLGAAELGKGRFKKWNKNIRLKA